MKLLFAALLLVSPARADHLENLLEALNAEYTTITSLIPDRVDFPEGESGNTIQDGENDMYDNGNNLGTNLTPLLEYSQATIAQGDFFGPGSSYFTLKVPGLFVMAADGMTISDFTISGNLGADGGGTVDAFDMSADLPGGSFRVLFKQVFGSGDPSVNHLILVPGGNSQVTHTFATNTDDDTHQITGLAGEPRIYYLLFAANNTDPLTQETVLAIAGKFSEYVRSKPVFAHLCDVKAGAAKCWGANESGQLGIEDVNPRGDSLGEMGAALPTVDLGADFPIEKIVTGGSHSCALSHGKVKCWGGNESGQLGQGDLVARGDRVGTMGDLLIPINLGEDVAVQDIAVGEAHTCVLASNRVKCFGDNKYGQLGLGDKLNRGDAADEMGDTLPWVDLGADVQAVSITAGANHTCVTLSSNGVRCFGRNSSGQLGNSRTGDVGDNPDEMGDRMFRTNLDPSLRLRKLASGSNHTCALTMDGNIWCWGLNGEGQLGVGDRVNRNGAANALITQMNLGRGQRARDLSCGGGSCCAVLMQGTMKCWGKNSSGQLGLGDQLQRGSTVDSIGDRLPFVSIDGLESVLQVKMGSVHTCAKLSTGWKCWGKNNMGQLGYGDIGDRGTTINTCPIDLGTISLWE